MRPSSSRMVISDMFFAPKMLNHGLFHFRQPGLYEKRAGPQRHAAEMDVIHEGDAGQIGEIFVEQHAKGIEGSRLLEPLQGRAAGTEADHPAALEKRVVAM